jgi:riboflavin kinase/FMN adenylyltransferase
MDDEKPVERYDAVANLGIRPMFESPVPLLETWLFNFSGDLYGKHLAIELVEYLRPEAQFPDMAALKVQIENDRQKASEVLSRVL